MRHGSGRSLRARALALGAGFTAVLALAAPGSAGAASPPIPRLTLTQLAGQRVIYSYPGLTPPAALLRRIRAGKAAGVIFFGENIAGRSQIREVIAELQHAAAQSPVQAPLLMLTDSSLTVSAQLPPAFDGLRSGFCSGMGCGVGSVVAGCV